MQSASNDTDCNELADYEWLTGPRADSIASDLAIEIAAKNPPLHRLADGLRRQLSPQRSRLLLDLVELRRRAAEKFTAAHRMFFTRVTLEQATDEWIASYKAGRFAGRSRVADLCCGIGGDLLALAGQSVVAGVDRDPVVAHLAAANVRATLPSHDAARAAVHLGDAESFGTIALRECNAWHIDPDRRPAGRRTSSAEWSSPGRAAIEQMLAVVPHAAIKLAPGAKPPAEWASRCELEWISRGGECRQLVAWHGDLAITIGSRQATVVESFTAGVDSHSFQGEPSRPINIVKAPARYVFDCDPAIHAARLQGSIAEAHGLSAFSAGPTYLTGDNLVDHALLASFEVLELLPLRESTLLAALRERGIGQLEIKKRGVDRDPERLRKSLQLIGDHAATLLVTNIFGRPAAILARRVTSTVSG